MRARGGLIGSNPSASQTVASNIWHIRDAESYSRSGNWPALPGAPTGVTGTAGTAQVALTWTAPAATGGYAITDYTIQYSSNSGSSWTTFSRSASTATSVAVTSLTNGTAYLFRVAAVTVLGTGAYSTTFSGSPAGSLLSLAYTAGSWNGTGASGSPYTSSSSFGPINNAVLPFTFTASSDCDVSLSLVQFNATADDNHGPQSGYFRIYNAADTAYTTLPIAWTNDATAVVNGTRTMTIRLFAGEKLRIYVSGSSPYNNPTDQYKNISVSAQAPSSSKLLLFNPTALGSAITGSGTSSDKFIAPNPLAAGKLANYFVSGAYQLYRTSVPYIVALEDCTIYFSATVQNRPDDNDQSLHIQAVQTNGAFNQSYGTGYLGEGVTGTSSQTIPRGTPFWFWQNSGGSQVSDMKVWAT
jgi:Fibronectin type III domain